MLIRRCAWHRQHFGYAVILGIAEWGGHGVAYTDGICRSCATLERRRLIVGDSATSAAARGLRRRAASRALAVLFTAGLVGALLAGDPGPRHEPGVGVGGRAVAAAAAAGLVTVPGLGVERSPAAHPETRRDSRPTRLTVEGAPVTTLRLAGQKPQSFHQLAYAADVDSGPTATGAAARTDPPSVPTTSHVSSPPQSNRMLTALRSVFEPRPADPPTVVALAERTVSSREERSEAP
jgi:hypothetical protein